MSGGTTCPSCLNSICSNGYTLIGQNGGSSSKTPNQKCSTLVIIRHDEPCTEGSNGCHVITNIVTVSKSWCSYNYKAYYCK